MNTELISIRYGSWGPNARNQSLFQYVWSFLNFDDNLSNGLSRKRGSPMHCMEQSYVIFGFVPNERHPLYLFITHLLMTVQER